MKLETIKNKGTEIFAGARISNGTRILSETLDTQLMRTTVGIHSKDEFKDSVYVYIDGEFNDIHTKDKWMRWGVKALFPF